MNDTRDVDAAEWLNYELLDALRVVRQRQERVDLVRCELNEANNALAEAFGKADAIRLIIAMAPLPLVVVRATE